MKVATMLAFLLLALLCSFFASGVPHEPLFDCNGYQKPKPTRCTLEYFPICGVNGQTYINKCLFCSAVVASQGKIHFKHYGKC
ncbi:ovomucoid [Pogona vitticeps]